MVILSTSLRAFVLDYSRMNLKKKKEEEARLPILHLFFKNLLVTSNNYFNEAKATIWEKESKLVLEVIKEQKRKITMNLSS